MNCREFLEGSTIHGLNHIASSARFIRLAWFVIVFLGFSLAGVLIWNSFDNWQQNPVATTISTYPIQQVSFPKIYVCPPKHTYTNLNQDIVDMKNVSLTDDQANEVKTLLELKIEQMEKENIVEETDSFEKENKYYNPG